MDYSPIKVSREKNIEYFKQMIIRKYLITIKIQLHNNYMN